MRPVLATAASTASLRGQPEAPGLRTPFPALPGATSCGHSQVENRFLPSGSFGLGLGQLPHSQGFSLSVCPMGFGKSTLHLGWEEQGRKRKVLSPRLMR